MKYKDVIFIDPNEVKYQMKKEKKFRKNIYLVNSLGGDWDLNIRERYGEDDETYVSMKDHFVNDKDWLQTKIFTRRYTRLFNKNKSVRGCNNLKELKNNYENYIDKLYFDIKTNGFLMPYDDINSEPIGVYIGRDGRIIYSDSGNHRLCIAKVLDLPSIPVYVHLRHRKWAKKKKQITNMLKKGKDIDIELLNHPDLKLIKNS